MARNSVKVLLLDVVLLIAEFYVITDLQWRLAFAASAHGHTTGYSPSFSYSVLTQWFTMSATSYSLTSPPTLDWVQLLAVALVLVNGWFVYDTYKKRRIARTAVAETAVQAQ